MSPPNLLLCSVGAVQNRVSELRLSTCCPMFPNRFVWVCRSVRFDGCVNGRGRLALAVEARAEKEEHRERQRNQLKT